MKRCLWITAVLLAAGCVEERDVYDPAVELGFMPAVYGSVRSAGGDSGPMTFRVSAWALPENLVWDVARDMADRYIVDEPAAESGGLWRTARSVDWPERTQRLSFMGYAPADAGARCDRTDGIVADGVDTSAECADLLFTEPKSDVSKFSNGGIVPLIFRHALCEVSFRVHRAVTGGGEIVLHRITMESMYRRGDFASLRTPQWRCVGECEPQLFFEGEFTAAASVCRVGEARLVIPQRLGCRVAVEFDYVNAFGEVLSRRLTTKRLDMLLEAGRRYTCTLTIAPDDVKFLHETMILE